MIGTRTFLEPVRRRRKPTPLRPFLQRAFGIARRRRFLRDARAEAPAHERGGSGETAVEIDRAENGFADIAEDRRLVGPAGLRLALAAVVAFCNWSKTT